MKKGIYLFLILILLVISTACSSLPKPENSRVGALMGHMEIQIDTEYGLIRQGKYLNNVMLRLENVDTGKYYMAYTQNGYFMYYNLTPGRYQIVTWKLYFSGAGQSYTWFHGPVKGVIIEIKPYTITMISKYRVRAYKNRSYEWDYPKEILDLPKDDYIHEFNENPQNEYWRDFDKEFVELKE